MALRCSNPPGPKTFCKDCLLNSRCFKPAVNMFSPTSCGRVKRFDALANVPKEEREAEEATICRQKLSPIFLGGKLLSKRSQTLAEEVGLALGREKDSKSSVFDNARLVN